MTKLASAATSSSLNRSPNASIAFHRLLGTGGLGSCGPYKITLMSDAGFRVLTTRLPAVETWYAQLIRNDSTHHLSNGQMSALSLHKALHQLADAYPDPKNGANTAISSALDVKFTQVFIQHPAAAPLTGQ